MTLYIENQHITKNLILSLQIDPTAVTCISLNPNLNAIVIDDYAFEGFENLTEVWYSTNIAQIGNHSFYNCTNLKSIALTTINKIGDYAFQNCISLSLIQLKPVLEMCNNAWGTFGLTTLLATPKCL